MFEVFDKAGEDEAQGILVVLDWPGSMVAREIEYCGQLELVARWPGGQEARWRLELVARWPGGQVARWGPGGGSLSRSESSAGARAFCSGKAFIEWCFVFQKKKKKMYIFLTGFWQSFWAFCEQIWEFWLHFMF